MSPSRRITGGSAVISNMVEPAPPRVRPPSIMASMPSPRLWLTSALIFDTKDQVSSRLSLSCYLLLFLVCNYSEHEKVSRGWLLISFTLSIG